MFSFDSRIRFSEVDESSKLDFASIINYFQDCSIFHSEEVGLGLEFFEKSKRAWLLNSWQIIVYQFPALCDHIKISTIPYEIKGIMGYRNFTITNEQDEVCVIADSSWVYVDTEKNRPVRTTDEETLPYGVSDKLDMDYVSGHIKLPESMTEAEPFPVVTSFLDTNHHVNNGQYVKLAENYLMKDFQANQIRVEYKKAAQLGDTFYPYVHSDKDKSIVAFMNEARKPYAIIEFCNLGGKYVTNR